MEPPGCLKLPSGCETDLTFYSSVVTKSPFPPLPVYPFSGQVGRILTGGAPMPKNIVICCDGTGNSFEKPDNDSNVVKLYSTLDFSNGDQVGYYHPGVGTMGDPMARNRLSRTWSVVKGLAFGGGLLNNVGDAYRFLINAYEDGDSVFLFGFSR